MAIQKGDRVVAREHLLIGWTSIRAGTKGIVTEGQGWLLSFDDPKVVFEGHQGEFSVPASRLDKL
jgi:hypothetical protein